MDIYLFTIGYEKRTINEYIALLKKFKIKILVDVRENAWSYKQDFRKKTLSDFLANENINYLHLPEAGNPQKIRRNSENIKECLSKYKRYIRKTEAGIEPLILLILNSILNGNNVCITCYEKDYMYCHRSILAEFIKEKIHNLNIINI